MALYVLAFMFLAGGALFTFLGYSNLVAARTKRATWIPAQGIVVRLAEEPGDRGTTLYAPVYRYTFDGIERTTKSSVASRPPDYAVGDKLDIVVNPSNPDDSDVMDKNVSIFSYGLLVMGVLVLLVGVLVGWLAVTGQMR